MILVTGGAGYIGSHCVMALLEKGYQVVIFDNLSTGHIETVNTLKNIGNVKFVEGDLREFEQINSVFMDRIEAVIHFAAYSQVGESVINPGKYYRNNVLGTLNLLDAMRRNGVNKIVFSSTAATYGEPVRIPIDETHPQNPINPYGQSKLMIEKIMDDYDKAYDLKSVRLRYFNVAGADSNCRIGEWHDPETHLIPNILKSTFSGGQRFKMFGTCVRDYINVEDLAAAHLLALNYLMNGGETNFFNLGTGDGNTVKEVFNTCETVTGKEIAVDEMNRREGDPASLIADNTRAKNILGWEPSKTLEQSIATAYNWEKILNERLTTKI